MAGAANAVPRFSLAEFSPGHAVVSAANTARDGSGTIVTIALARTNPAQGGHGLVIEVIHVNAIATTVAGMVRLFLSSDGGTTWRLYHEIPVTAITVAADVPAFEAEYVPLGGLILPPGWALGASTEIAATFIVRVASGGEF